MAGTSATGSFFFLFAGAFLGAWGVVSGFFSLIFWSEISPRVCFSEVSGASELALGLVARLVARFLTAGVFTSASVSDVVAFLGISIRNFLCRERMCQRFTRIAGAV